MWSQTKTQVKLKRKEATQACYKKIAGRCVLALSWQQVETVSYGTATPARAKWKVAPLNRNLSPAERLPAKNQTITTAFHREPQNTLGVNLDPWNLRDRFLLLDLNAGADLYTNLRDFLGNAGFAHDIPVGKTTKFPLPSEQIAEWQERQRFLKQWQKLEPAKWESLNNDFPALVTYAVNGCGQYPANVISLSWQDNLPVITWVVQDVWSAIVATVHFDKMRGIRLRACKECGGPVPPVQRTPYCGQKCRHAATVRAGRARENKRV